MNIEIINIQKAEAEKNKSKSVNELKVGDFINLTMCGLKNGGSRIIDVIEGLATSEIHPSKQLCKIEKIVHCTEEELFSNKFEFGEGGSASDVFESQKEADEFYTKSAYLYFYTLVTLVIADSGRFVFTDAEGYDYPRYILVRDGYQEMFKAEIEKNRSERENRVKAIHAEHLRKCEEQKAKLRQEVSEKYGYLDPKKSVKANWIAVCKKLFDFPVKVSKQKGLFGRVVIRLFCEDSEQCSKVSETVRDLENHFQYETGEFEESCDGYLGEVIGNAIEDLIPEFFYDVSADF